MVKRKHHQSFPEPEGFRGIFNPRKHVRQHRRQPHFTFGVVPRTMEVEQSHPSKKQKQHNGEARMIPGLGKLEYGFPNTIITKLRYHDVYSYQSTTGGVNSWVLRANGIFDPDYSNTGHQPMYRDTYAGIYDYYVVLGSKIHVDFVSESATNGFCVGIVTSDTPTISTVLNTLAEQNNAVSTITGTVNDGKTSLFMTYSPMENIGMEAEDDLSTLTTVGSDPSTVQYYGIWIATSDAVTTAKCTIKATIEYTVKFATLSKPAQN